MKRALTLAACHVETLPHAPTMAYPCAYLHIAASAYCCSSLSLLRPIAAPAYRCFCLSSCRAGRHAPHPCARPRLAVAAWAHKISSVSRDSETPRLGTRHPTCDANLRTL